MTLNNRERPFTLYVYRILYRIVLLCPFQTFNNFIWLVICCK